MSGTMKLYVGEDEWYAEGKERSVDRWRNSIDFFELILSCLSESRF